MKLSKKLLKTFRRTGKIKKNSYDQLSTWWEIGEMYMKMLATHYCVTMQKNIRKKQDELIQLITTEKIKQNPNKHKINKAQQHLEDI